MKKYNNIALIVSGGLGAGKSIAAKFISENYDYQHLSFVDEIWKPILSERKLEFNRSNLQILGIELMKDPGPEQISNLLLEKAMPGKRIIIDDVRRKDVVDIIDRLCSGIFLVYIDANFEDRYPRLVNRDNIASREEQLKAEKVKTELTIPKLKETADMVIPNKGNIEEYFKLLNNVVAKVEIKFAKWNKTITN